jgi:hypothetical protein
VRHFKPEKLRELLLLVPERHRLMLVVAFWHALRVSELIELTSRSSARRDRCRLCNRSCYTRIPCSQRLRA